MANNNSTQNQNPTPVNNAGTSNQNANTVNRFNNQLNASDYYGIGRNGCTNQGCVSNVVNRELYTIPALTDIAAYNRAVIYDQNQQQQLQNNLQATQEAERQETQQSSNTTNEVTSVPLTGDVPDTPATVLNYGATMDNGLQNDMGVAITDYNNPYPITAESIQYLNGFIRTQIGRRVTIDFLVGSNTIVTRSGYLLGVASNYILINELDTNDITTCDFYNIKFIRFYY